MKPRYFNFYAADWISETIGLTNSERGLYITALMLICAKRGPISRENLRAACRDHGNAFNQQLSHLLERGKLLLTEDGKLMDAREDTVVQLHSVEDRP